MLAGAHTLRINCLQFVYVALQFQHDAHRSPSLLPRLKSRGVLRLVPTFKVFQFLFAALNADVLHFVILSVFIRTGIVWA